MEPMRVSRRPENKVNLVVRTHAVDQLHAEQFDVEVLRSLGILSSEHSVVKSPSIGSHVDEGRVK
jgi:hypothetical protein